ncbi:MAG: family efflux transporter, subunit [Chthoniobacteraceae bacterium]|nr:family efflux transporter, subunit [Chthoniobacteraceae bacterium]
MTAGFFTLLLSLSAFAQIKDSILANGKVQAASEREVKPAAAGRIKKLYAGLGNHVKAGDILVELELSGGTVRAPVNGIILTIPVKEKQEVVPADGTDTGTTLMTIGDPSQLLVQTHVNLKDASKLFLEQIIQITADSRPEGEAELCFIAPIATTINSIKGLEVKALIKKPGSRLKPGMTVQLSVPTASL